MVFTIIQSQILINQFNNLNINQKFHMDAPVNHFLIPFEGIIHTKDPQGIKFYLQETNDIDKESDKFYIPVSNAKDIIDHFLSLAKKYGWGSLEFMVDTGAGAKKIFQAIEQIQIPYMNHQAHGCFGLIGI